jgi:phosphoribosyl 1,2-cyclic phosphodiesterase
MIIRCYGARGSIAVSGEEYLKYGGDTTCLEIRSKNDEIIIVDAGTGIRRLGNKLLSENRFEYSVIFTHSHLDHIVGFPFFKPVYHKKATIDILGCPATQGNIQKLLSRAMGAPLFPVPFEQLKANINYSGECALSFQVDSVEVFPINLSHPNVGMGYKFVEDGKKFVFLTDNELGYRHREGRSFEE